jgi:hypothetical protein
VNVVAWLRSNAARHHAARQYENRIRVLSRTEDDLRHAGRSDFEVHGAVLILDRAREQELHAEKLNGEGWW